MYINTHATATSLLRTVAQLLIAQAEADADFGTALSQLIQATVPPITAPEKSTDLPYTRYVRSCSNEQAYMFAQWLVYQLQDLTEPEHYELASQLVAWSNQYESPQAIAMGFAGTVIPVGIVGIITNKKNQKVMMQILVDQSYYREHSPAARLDLSTELSLSLLTEHLKAVDGDTKCLDPDLFEWLYSDRKISIGLMASTEMATAYDIIRADDLPHIVRTNDDKPIACALHPVVDPALMQELGATPLR